MTDARRFPAPKVVVVKIGSSSLRADDGRLDVGQVRSLAAQLAQVRAAGTKVVLVSSGAVAAGLAPLGLSTRPTDTPTLQAAASVGQGELVHHYQQALSQHGIACAQILLTQDDFVRRRRYLTGRTAFRRLLELGALPVVNENDAVATEELVYGDNDRLAALVASMLEADLLVLLSDVDGLYDRDPRNDPSAQLIGRVDDLASIDPRSVGGSGSSVGSGGMRTKVEAGRVAALSGCHAVVAHARRVDVVVDAVAGADIGTWFVAQPRRLDARKLWIGFALATHGRVGVDDGAVAALRRGGSLLAVGVTGAEGSFSVGDAVEVVAPGGVVVARGLVNFDLDTLRRIAGRSSDAAAAELGATTAREVIHRDDLVLLA